MDMWGVAPISGFVRGDSLGHAVQDFNAGAPEGDFMAGLLCGWTGIVIRDCGRIRSAL